MKSLVIYFSHTGENYMERGIENITEGNTKIVAEIIKEVYGSDLFEVKTKIDYPYNYKECCDIAKVELEKNIRRELQDKVEDISVYDTIFVGGPVWWGHYPTALFEVLENLDFTGKVVYPFTTHEGSGVGSVVEDVKKYAKGATIKTPLAIRGCRAREAKKLIIDWLK